jgi:hypothetical protein
MSYDERIRELREQELDRATAVIMRNPDATTMPKFNKPSPHETSWPKPLKPEAFYGPAGEIVRAIEPHTEADPAAVLIQLLIGFGNVIGRSAFFRASADRHYLNLYGVLVGKTAKGRKGSSWSVVLEVLKSCDSNWAQNQVVSGLSSGEGLIWVGP